MRVIAHQANESANDQPSQLSFSSVDEVKIQSIVKNEIDVTDDCCYETTLKIEEENDSLNRQLTDINETWKKLALKIEKNETEDCNYETKIKLEEGYFLDTEIYDGSVEDIKLNNFEESYYNSRSTVQNKPKKIIDKHTYNVNKTCNGQEIKAEVDILNGCIFESVIEVDRNLSFGLELTDKIQSFACHMCQKSFSSKRRIVHHIQEAHNLNSIFRKSRTKKIVINKHCGKAMGIVINIKKKTNGWCVNTEKANGLNECDVCFKKLPCKAKLVIHERVHTGEKPYRCYVCKKMFSCSASLKKHRFIHTGEKPYKCNICNQSCASKNDLKNHERVHTGEKPFECVVCRKSFSRNDNLRAHERLHAGEKRFKCYVCEQFFAKKETLKRHERVHTGEKPYKCLMCRKSFSRKYFLESHQADVHD